MRREDHTRAILTGALFVALFVILLISLGRASHLVPGPTGPFAAIEEQRAQR
jgi:hypothetical protein